MNTSLIAESFEIAALRCSDLTPLVYSRLFREDPTTEPLFQWIPERVRGNMLATTVETILNFTDESSWSPLMLTCEQKNHADYKVSPDMFVQFFDTMMHTLRDILGEDWTPQIEAEWRKAIQKIKDHVRGGEGL